MESFGLTRMLEVDDTATTLMLADVPAQFHVDNILRELRDHGLEDHIDYFYFPPECARGRARGRRMTGPFYAFVNFTSSAWAQEAQRLLHGTTCHGDDVQWTIRVLRAEAQGVAPNLMKFRSVRRGHLSTFEDTWPRVRVNAELVVAHPVAAIKLAGVEAGMVEVVRDGSVLRHLKLDNMPGAESPERTDIFLKGWAPDKAEHKHNPRKVQHNAFDRRQAIPIHHGSAFGRSTPHHVMDELWMRTGMEQQDRWDHGRDARAPAPKMPEERDRDRWNLDWPQENSTYAASPNTAYGKLHFYTETWPAERYDDVEEWDHQGWDHHDHHDVHRHEDAHDALRWHELPGLGEPLRGYKDGVYAMQVDSHDRAWFDEWEYCRPAAAPSQAAYDPPSRSGARSRPPSRRAPPPGAA